MSPLTDNRHERRDHWLKGSNTMAGGVTVEDSGDGTGTLVFESVATTMIAGPADVASVETHGLSVLQERVDYVIDGRQLKLTNGSQGDAVGRRSS